MSDHRSSSPRPRSERDRIPGTRSLAFALGTLLLLAIGGALLVYLAVEVEAGTEAYVVAEARWSSGAVGAVRAMQLYLATEDPQHLRMARQRLAIPLAARRGRLALEAEPPDPGAAREAFGQVVEDPAAAARMVRFYRTFANTDTGRRVVGLWRVAEAQVLRLEDLADTLEAWRPLTVSRRAVASARLETIGGTLPPLEGAFARQLRRASGDVRAAVMRSTAGGFLLIAALVAWSFQRAFRALRDAERHFRESFEQAALGMARLDPSGRFLAANRALATMLGRPRHVLEAGSLADVLHPEDVPDSALLARMAAAPANASDTSERRFVRGDGSVLWGRLTLSRLRLGSRAGEQLLAAVDDVSEARKVAEELTFQARHDRLTGLANRYEIERRLQAALAATRRRGVTHALCFVDLDKFKVVNDTAGHMAGDHMLRQVADVLQRSLRANDTLGRLGGDEFAIIFDHTDAAEAERAAGKLRDRLAETMFQWEGHTFDVGCSIGVVAISPDAPDVAWLLRAADSACYLAKGAGGNQVHVYQRADEAVAAREGQRAWTGHVREAIESDRLALMAQSIVPSGAPAEAGHSFEVLVRLRDEDGTLHPPHAFMPVAERYGLAPSVDLWAARHVVAALEAHPGARERTARCHLNVSTASLGDEAFEGAFLEALSRSGLPPERFCVDIAEDAVMAKQADTQAFVSTLHEHGHVVSLEDFGRGLASFAYLTNLPVDLVKIDGGLVQRAAHRDLDRTLVRSVQAVAATLGRDTVASQVESDEVREAMEALGVDYLQGHVLHAPEPLGAWLERLERGESTPG